MISTKLDSGCCGELPRSHGVTLVGIATICVPLATVFLALRPLLWVTAGTRFGRIARSLAQSNARLIAETPLFPRLKCKVAGGSYRISPLLSGFVFRNFNFLFLLGVGGLLLGTGGWLWRRF